jgi:1,4-alpha-glucan branching enzyme
MLLKKSWLFLAVLLPFSILAQVVTTDPAFPGENNSVVITFNADQGSQGLMDYSGDIWAHTGVITENSGSGSDWKYVVAGWSENTDKAKLTRISANVYTLDIGPSIREFYGVPDGEEILQMAFVFRNSDGSKTGKEEGELDIYADVYESGLNVDIESPISGTIINQNETIQVVVNGKDADYLKFYINNELISEYDPEGFMYDYLASNSGKTTFKVEAYTQDNMVADSAYIFVKGDVIIEERPAGMKDGPNYISETSVVLSLLAPGKEYAFAIGDFSNWEVNDEVFMKKTPGGERFWIQIDGLTPGQPYIYQYYIDGELKVADVYADQISDPWNDQYINEETYPNLPDYPSGKTSGIASVLTTAQQAYDWQVENFQAPKVTDLVIQEILIRDIHESHSFQFLIDTINYFKNLGVNVMELMPVNEFEGNISWGYNPSFYFAVDKYYGPKDKLKEFIDVCHANGMAVVIDMVLNHSYGQNPQVQMYWDANNNRPSADNPWFNQQSPNSTYSWGYDYNHESPFTEAFVDSVNSYWLTEYKVDGFRFDFTKGFTNNGGDGWAYDADRIAILQRMANEIWAVNSDAYVIFEHLADNSEEKVLANSGILLWGNMNHNFKEANMGYNSSGKSDLSWSSYQRRTWSQPNLVSYMESHDEDRQQYYNNTWGNSSGSYDITNEDIGLRRIAMSTLFHTIIPGPKMYWQFGELGYDYSINWPSGNDNDRLTPKPPRWDYYDDWRRNHLYRVTAALNKLKTQEDAWETTDYEISVYGAIKRVTLLSNDMNVVAVGNFDVVETGVSIEFPNGGVWYNYFDDQRIDLGSETTWTTTLAPGDYYLFTTVELENPNLGTGIQTEISVSNGIMDIYPNPVNDQLNISILRSAKGAIEFQIINLSGEIVKTQKAYSLISRYDGEMNLNDLPTGVYIVKAQLESGIYNSKFIKL